MTKSITKIKEIVAIMLNIFASVLVGISYMISVYKYGWTQEPQIYGNINADAVLSIIVFSVISLISAIVAFFLKRKYRSIEFLFFLVLLLLNIYKLIIVIPVYSG